METFDYQSQFEKMKKDTVAAINKALNISAKRTGRELRVTDVQIDDSLDPADWESQRTAVRNDKTWGVPVYASLELVDKESGKVLSKAKGMRVATIPKATDIGSFIVGGKHYQVYNQLRRKPGVYVIEKGDRELSAEINIASNPFNVEFDSKSGVFMIKKKAAKRPLYPILSRMGVADSTLAKAWGEQVLAANKAITAKRADTSVKTVAKMFTGTVHDSADAAAKELREYFETTQLAPEVTKRTLGKEYSSLSPDLIVRGSEELLKAARGERRPDDRQALEFKKIFSVGDFIKERLFNEEGGLGKRLDEVRNKIHAKLNDRAKAPTQVSRVINTDQLTPLFETFFTQTELSHTPDQTNPLHILNGLSRVTLTGEGGASSEHGLKAEERAVHPSQMGFIDPIHTPDSESIGIVTTLPVGVVKSGHDMKTRVFDVKTKTYKYISPSEARELVFAFPDQYKDNKPVTRMVRAIVDGETRVVDSKTVNVVLASPKQAFSISSNTIPFLPSAQGVRAQMATKMLEQAIPLSSREAPLVQSKLGSRTVERDIGEAYSIHAADDGIVEKITANRITIKTKDGVVEQPIYNNFPLNMKSFMHADTTVAVGDSVKKGQVIADSNFTRGGELAIGTNLLAAYIPYKGYNFEDGIVITESAREKLTSEHMYQYAQPREEGTTFSADKYTAWRSNDLTVDQQSKLDDEGVVRKGQIVKKGDPLWVGVRESKTDPDTRMLMRLAPSMKPYKPFKETWEGDVDGEVVDVVKTGKRVKVYVKAKEPAQIGDKLTNRHGGKGIITKIIPDGEAPQTADGTGVDILLNPHGIVTRMNPSQILETAAAKIAAKTGKPYIVDNFSGADYSKQVFDDLAKNGIEDTELLFDPHSKEPLGKVLVGPHYMLKLTKQATTQFSARAEGKYDINRSPLRGGEDGAKAVDLLTMYSMLAHGARANLREMATYKATKNQGFWNWLEAGPALGLIKPSPEPTFAYKKFEAYLKAGGVDIQRNGSKFVLSPMTDVGVDKMTSGAVQEPLFLRAKDLREERGGLMDPLIFGPEKDRWGHIDLAEPMPNPIFEEPIKRLTDLNNAQYKSLVRGERFIDTATGQWNADGQGITGGAAIKHLLSQINVDESLKDWTDKAKSASDPKKLDEANKHLKYLSALKKFKLRPEDAYVQTKLPVIPPQFRPVTELPDGTLSAPGLNYLYRDLGLINKELGWQKGVAFIPESMKAELRQNLYDGAKALYGLGDPIAFYPEARRPKGVIEQIEGKQNKMGFFQHEVLRRRQNLVGRGTIIPEPKLGVDEVGLPEDMAWDIFRPFVIRRMVTGQNKKPDDALNEFKARTPAARAALDAEMLDHPVLLNRAPSLHKFSVMAFKPKITDGHAVKIPPLIIKGYNADFDGDAMTVHVPVLPDAIDEAYKMLPSRHLYNPGTGGVMIAPQNEAQLGLFLLSKSVDPAKQKVLSNLIPESMRAKYKDKVWTKTMMNGFLDDLAQEQPRDYGKIVDGLKAAGDEHAYRVGFTVGIKDLMPDLPEKRKIFADTNAAVSALTDDSNEDPTARASAIDVIRAADAELNIVLKKRLGEQGNNLFLMVDSGARGNMNQLKQVVSAPFLVEDHRGNPLPFPITKSFAEGLPFSDYWNTLYGARAVAVDKQLQTQHPGAFNKDMMAATTNNVISKDDCGTHAGITLSISDQGRDVEDRFLSKDVRVNGNVVAKSGSPVDSGLLNMLRERNVKTVEVRSPLTCRAPKGTCAKCYGLDDQGQMAPIGENVGAISGQSLTEPLTQMTMRTFHTGGLAGTRGIITGYEAIDKLLTMPKIKHGKATLSELSGKVEKIAPTPGGTGQTVTVGGQEHFVQQDLWDPSKIKIGTSMQKGDALSSGLIHPQELTRLKGMLAAKGYIADQLQSAYKDSAGILLKRRAIETVLRSVGNTTRILDPGDSNFLAGDVAPWTIVEDLNDKNMGKMKLGDAMGHMLKEDVGSLKSGTVIDERISKALERLGKREVEVGPKQIVHVPFLTGLKRVPIMRDDWMAQMGYRELKQAIVGGAAAGKESDIHGYSPIPAFAYGAEFGEAPDGKSVTEGVY
jgi:DNA-directed RNA polymerase subunit beta'